jgi:hypothetical protein
VATVLATATRVPMARFLLTHATAKYLEHFAGARATADRPSFSTYGARRLA